MVDLPIDITPEQKAALVIADRLEKHVAGLWTYIESSRLANSLRQRIYAPIKINQKMIPGCAPAAIAYDLASTKPNLYAQIIYDLFTSGYGYLPSMANFDGRLVASEDLRRAKATYDATMGIQSNIELPEADWVLLSTIRNSESWFNAYWGTDPVIGAFNNITLPSTFESWLKAVGYTITINYTNLVRNCEVDNLIDADSLMANKWKVFLFINSHVLYTSSQDNMSLLPNHYVSLLSRIKLDDVSGQKDRNVSFSCQTYGRVAQIPQSIAKKLSETQFLKHYWGYIAGRM